MHMYMQRTILAALALHARAFVRVNFCQGQEFYLLSIETEFALSRILIATCQ